MSSAAFSADTDRDDLPDDWETANGRNPLVADYQITAGAYHTCALDDAGVKCWGRNNEGQSDVPSDLSNPTQISAGTNHTRAIDDSGVVCWGTDHEGNGNNGRPFGMVTLTTPTKISAGNNLTCAPDSGQIICWSRSREGQLSVGNSIQPLLDWMGYLIHRL